ncbi:unnamed protein product [Mesocestoides corti]|uniref:sn-1-specific diacylglycerol lipase n=1 Tax=Mesocestoides corti TaxID=53468 RepID=A0A158QVZ4_MESCO|nr:unnamed protein product [Mesocestoides corti]
MVDNHLAEKADFSSFVAVIAWCAILLFTIVCEIIDWIRHFDKHGRLKYQFYQTFLYGDGNDKTDDEKRELIEAVRQISHIRWSGFISDKITSSKSPDDPRGEAVTAVASAISDLLTDLDLTFSDLAVGLLLLQWQTKYWIGGQSRVPAKYVLKQTDPVLTDLAAPNDKKKKNPIDQLNKDWLHISRLKRYSHLVNASYGWIYYYLENPCDCTALNRLCQKISWKNPTAPKRQVDLENGIDGPGGCMCAGYNCYLAAFLEMTQLECDDILIFDITDQFYDATVMLIIDDATEAIVIIVRGTLSGDDTLVDMVAAGAPLRNEDNVLPADKQLIGHGGMCRTAQNIVSRIIEEGWVEAARRLRPRYPVVICGHSLGAGLVSLMSALLQPSYPELKAYAFSPPGGLMNENLARHTRPYLCSITYGYDCVGRLGSQTLEDQRARIFHALCVYKVPKFIVLGTQMCLSLLRSTKIDRLLPSERSLMRWKNPECHQLLSLPRPYPRSLYPKSLKGSEVKQKYTIDWMIKSLKNPVPSGRLLHILEVDSDFEIKGVEPYRKRGYKPPPIALWADANTFNSLLIHPKMLFNHSPIAVSTAIDRLYNSIVHPEKVFHKIHTNTWHREMEPVKGITRNLTEKDVEKFSRARKLK